MPSLREVVGVLDEWYPPSGADDWDAVGLVCGSLDSTVGRILLAIDAVPATVAEAERSGVQLLITHHPLLLSAVHAIAADSPKGGLVHRMIRSSIAHFVAHSNAEAARPGVSDALADAVGLHDVSPIEPAAEPLLDQLAKLVVFVPGEGAARLFGALSRAGAGAVGAYDRCAWSSLGIGTFRAGPGAHPAIGAVGEISEVAETRLEMVVPRVKWPAVLSALRANHPYEEPAFDLLARLPEPDARGAGRIGTLSAPMSLADFTQRVAAVLPATVGGVLSCGDPARSVARVAVLAGAGSSLIDVARERGADVFVTADLKHHHALEAVTQRTGATMALVDVSHWASERPWLDALAARLRTHFGATVEPVVSNVMTDPWTQLEVQSADRTLPTVDPLPSTDPESRPPTPW